MEIDLIDRICNSLPENLSYLVLMGDGTVVQTNIDPEQGFQLPTMAEALLSMENHVKKFFSCTPWPTEPFRKLFFTTSHFLGFITKVDEFRHLALLFPRSDNREERVALIHKILETIELMIE